ncbi:MAG: group 1 glycosyl transferase [Parcubacteria group bacterium Athens0714_24]|nr:MAG: group 1 glycosyl transferase [Parcubacteria group bacterium Athens0714_24]
MKIIYLANIGISAGWAHEIQIMKMCEALALSGLEIELIVPRRPLFEIKGDVFTYYGVEKKFKIIKLFCFDLLPGNPSNITFLIRLFSFLIFARIYLTFKKYDVLYSREQLVGLFFKNFYLEIHSLPSKIKDWHKKIWKKAKKLIVLTSFIKTGIIEFGISPEKILIAPDAVDLKEFDIKISKDEARKNLSLPLDKKIILYTGSFYLHGWKGVDILLESAKYFSDEYLFVLVGGEKNEIEKIKNDYPLDNLLLVERKTHGEIPYYLKTADVLILPNKKGEEISEKYTSPMKLFEYMASGRPIVASDLPSLREILNSNNSVLVEANNPESLADGIKKIFSDVNLADKISKQSFYDVQNYTWLKRGEKIFNFINQ